MAPFDHAQEKRIIKALEEYATLSKPNIAKLARKHMILDQTFRRRLNGIPAGNRGGTNSRLNANEEEGLRKYMAFLYRIGMPPGKLDIVQAANSILVAAGKPKVSKEWARRWMKRNRELFKSIRGRTLSAERKDCHQKEEIDRHFSDFTAVLAEYKIRQEDVWNFDEIGFRIGCLRGRTVIVPADVKAIYLADPDNRESITSLECVSAKGKSIESYIIVKGEVMKEKLFDNDIDDNTWLAVTPTGFTNDRNTFRWLEHFDRRTRENIRNRWRLLVMDGHSSHLSDHFKYYCWTHRIIPFLLPSHSTHLLQPLDVGVFSAMKQHHQNELYASIRFGDASFDRVDFFDAWKKIHTATMKPKTIYSGWVKTGLFSRDPAVVFASMARFDSESKMVGSNPSPSTPPSTPPLRPFQQPPNTASRHAHEAYLEKRIEDHIEDICPLTPSYSIALRAYHEYTARKSTEITLIERNNVQRREHTKRKADLKNGSNRYVQKSGAIRFGDARSQIQERETEEWLKEGEKDVVNMAEERAKRAKALEVEKAARSAVREEQKKQRAEVQAVVQQEHIQRKDATKVIAQELSKALSRAGLRARNSQYGKELWKPLEVYVKHYGQIWEGEKPNHDIIDIYVKWRIEYTKMLLDMKEDQEYLKVLQAKRGVRRRKAFSSMKQAGDTEG